MGATGWTSLSLKDSLVKRIDAFIEANTEGFSNRSEVIAAALRQFLAGQEGGLTRAELERALRAVAATEPTTPTALLEALLAELDMKVAHRTQASTPKSNSDSTKRR